MDSFAVPIEFGSNGIGPRLPLGSFFFLARNAGLILGKRTVSFLGRRFAGDPASHVQFASETSE